MSLADALGATPPDIDPYSQATPPAPANPAAPDADLAQHMPIDPLAVAQRLLRRGFGGDPNKVIDPVDAAQELLRRSLTNEDESVPSVGGGKADYGKLFGDVGTPAADLASFGNGPIEDQKAEGEAPVAEAPAGQLQKGQTVKGTGSVKPSTAGDIASEVAGDVGFGARNILQSATDMAGQAIKGAVTAPPVSDDAMAQAFGVEPTELSPEAQAAVAKANAVPPEQKPGGQTLYPAGEAIKQFGENTFGVTPEERAQHPILSPVTGAVGTIAPLIGLGMVSPGAALAGGAALFGLSSAQDTYEEAKTKGADETTAQQAASMSGAVNAVLGMAPIGDVLAPIAKVVPEKLAQQMSGWAMQALVRAGESGAVFAGVGEAQQYLGQQIAQQYDPNAHHSGSAFAYCSACPRARSIAPSQVSVPRIPCPRRRRGVRTPARSSKDCSRFASHPCFVSSTKHSYR